MEIFANTNLTSILTTPNFLLYNNVSLADAIPSNN